MTEYIEHETTSGERWDHIAYKYYGDGKRISELIRANRDLFLPDLKPVPIIFRGRIKIRVPILEAPALDDNLLPPWKRRQ